jgi:hypothetical protein
VPRGPLAVPEEPARPATVSVAPAGETKRSIDQSRTGWQGNAGQDASK